MHDKKRLAGRITATVLTPVALAAALFLMLYAAFGAQLDMLSAFKLFISDTATADGGNMFERTDGVSKEPVSSGYVDIKSIEWPDIGSLYAYISVPDLGISNVELYYGALSDTRKNGAVQSTDSFLPGYGGTVLTSGHCTTHFAFLEDIKQGHEVHVRTYYGEFVYKVSSTEIIDKADSERYQQILSGDKEILVMYTCYPFSTLWTGDRYVVFCDKLSGPEIRS